MSLSEQFFVLKLLKKNQDSYIEVIKFRREGNVDESSLVRGLQQAWEEATIVRTEQAHREEGPQGGQASEPRGQQTSHPAGDEDPGETAAARPEPVTPAAALKRLAEIIKC